VSDELPAARSVLVTGASGLIGRRVVSVLATEQTVTGDDAIDTIVAFDLRDVDAGQRLSNVEYCRGDIREPGLADLLRQHAVDTVVHLAAVVTPGPNSSRELEHSIDVLGTENVLDSCLRAGVRQLIYTSSGAAYGYHADNPQPLCESDPLRGNEEFAYSHHKRLAEEVLAKARREHPALAQLIFRPGTVLGERVNNPITAIFDRPLVIGVRGSEAPFVFIWEEDVARCIVRGIRHRRSGIYNLAGDGAIALREIARRVGKPYVALPPVVLRTALRVARVLGLSSLGPEQVRFLRYRPVLSNANLKSEFGFVPTYSSEQCFEHYRAIHFPG
jgi:UDP-glucose 4-epimerase